MVIYSFVESACCLSICMRIVGPRAIPVQAVLTRVRSSRSPDGRTQLFRGS